jgi:hypothetical protein
LRADANDWLLQTNPVELGQYFSAHWITPRAALSEWVYLWRYDDRSWNIPTIFEGITAACFE